VAALLDREELSYRSLADRWQRERARPFLTKMSDGFYEAFDAHLRALHEEYRREQAAGPATPKALILLDELTKLQSVRDDIYNLRESKILGLALVAARGGRSDRSNLTREEEILYEAALKALTDARQALLRKEEAQASKSAAGPPAPPEPAPVVPVAAQPASIVAPVPPHEAPLDVGRPVSARVLVRVKQTVDPFVAPDLRHYRLMAEDVAALPRDVAHLLVARGAAAALPG
jgi:DNA replication initiation complex subunit (GINS family)